MYFIFQSGIAIISVFVCRLELSLCMRKYFYITLISWSRTVTFESIKNSESSVFLIYIHIAILNCYNLDVFMPAGALALHAQIFLYYLNILIMNWPLLRTLKMGNQKYLSYNFIFQSWIALISMFVRRLGLSVCMRKYF